MAMTDPIANFITILRNASKAKHESAMAPASNVILKIAGILKEERFIRDFREVEEEGKRSVKVYMRYLKNGKPALKFIQRVSKPGLRNYSAADSLPRVLNGLGVAIVSTPEGLMTDETARQKHLGGELLCKVY